MHRAVTKPVYCNCLGRLALQLKYLHHTWLTYGVDMFICTVWLMLDVRENQSSEFKPPSTRAKTSLFMS